MLNYKVDYAVEVELCVRCILLDFKDLGLEPLPVGCNRVTFKNLKKLTLIINL